MSKEYKCPYCESNDTNVTEDLFPQIFCYDCGSQSPYGNTPEQAYAAWRKPFKACEEKDEYRREIIKFAEKVLSENKLHKYKCPYCQSTNLTIFESDTGARLLCNNEKCQASSGYRKTLDEAFQNWKPFRKGEGVKISVSLKNHIKTKIRDLRWLRGGKRVFEKGSILALDNMKATVYLIALYGLFMIEKEGHRREEFDKWMEEQG